MKKLFAFLLLGVFLINLGSAAEWDNAISDYDEETKTVTIKNGCIFDWAWTCTGEVIGQAKLNTPLNVEVPRGYQKVAEFEIWAYDDYNNALKQFSFEDMKNERKKINRDYDLKKRGYEEVEIKDYYYDCYEVWNITNNSNVEICDKIQNGTHTEQRETWNKITPADLKKNEVLTIGIFTEVQKGDYVDWIPMIFGVEVPEWATWTESLNVNLEAYFKLYDNLATTNTINEVGVNWTATDNTEDLYTPNGIISGGFDLTGASNEWVESPTTSFLNTENAFSISAWIKPESLPDWAGIVFTRGTSSSGIHLGDDGNIRAESTGVLIDSGTGTIVAGNWYHIVLTFDGITLRGYINNSEFDNTAHTTDLAVDDEWYIGLDDFNTVRSFDGIISEVGIWNRSLSVAEVEQLWNNGAAITQIDNVVSVILNYPLNDSGVPETLTQFNCSAEIPGGENLTNMSLYTNESGTWESKNITTGLSVNSTTQVWNRTLIDRDYIYSCEACGSNGRCSFALSNYTFVVDTIFPTISIESPSGTLDYNFIGNNETLNVTFTDTNLDSCWYNYNGTNITIEGCLTGIKNSTNFTLETDNTNMTLYANDSAGNENSTFISWNYAYLENSRTHNTTSYETASELFSINVEGPTSTVLVYNGTDYSTSKSGDNFNVTIQVPVGNLGNRSLYWRFDDTQNSFTSYQNVSETVFTLCNATYTEDFLNISFKNEADLSELNASIPTSTFEYYLGDGTLTKSLTYVNTSNHYNYTFCAAPNRTFKILPTVQYKQGIIYPQRTWQPAVQTYNNTLTSQILYLLNTIDGLFVTFQIINPANQVLSGVEVIAIREISGEDITVGTGTTGASGTVTLWLNPDFSHDFTFSKSGLPTISESFPPTQTAYTITMAGASVTQNSTIRGIDYSIIPTNTFLENDTSYIFGFNLTSSFWDVDSYGFNLRLTNGTIIIGDSTSISGTALIKSYDVNNQSLIYLDAFWIIKGNYTNITRYWAIQNTEYSGYSIAVFFTDLNTYMDSGLFGIDDFGRYLIAFIILFVSVGLMGQKFGISSPLGVLTLTFMIVFFLDTVTSTIPTIGGIENLPTYISGLILTLAALNEVRLRI